MEQSNKEPEIKKTDFTETPKEKYHSFKSFARASNVSYNLISGIIIGLIVGYFLDKWFGRPWMLISILVFTGIGIFNFYRSLMRLK